MELSTRWGTVNFVQNYPGRQELLVQIGQETEKAINYPKLTGSCQKGDQVLLNTTAAELKLGTGGYHYVLAIYGRERSLSKYGHIMKLRYTPVQGRVLSVEEQDSPYHQVIAQAESLHGLKVAVGSLHSMLAPLAWAFKHRCNSKRLVYLMSDGAALPLDFSKIVGLLKQRGLLDKTITFGHAFGGDLEAVNIYSALLAARHVLKADLAVVLMGPGVVGTNTTWGTTAIEQGVYLNAVSQLGGQGIAIPRLSEKDPRPRHVGLSHHTQTVLRKVIQSEVDLPLPLYFQKLPQAMEQLKGLTHRISWEDTEADFAKLSTSGLPLSTMGRGLRDDPLFFHGVLATVSFLAREAYC